MKVWSTAKTRFIERFQRGQSLRLHMTLILLATVGAGLLATRLLLALHLNKVVVRYPLAVLFAYCTFFLGVKLWLKYVAAFPGERQAGRNSSGSGIDWISGSSGSGSSGGSGGSGGGFRGGGGNFGGGGASGGFGEADAVLAGSGAELAPDVSEAGGSAVEAAGSAAGEAEEGQ